MSNNKKAADINSPYIKSIKKAIANIPPEKLANLLDHFKNNHAISLHIDEADWQRTHPNALPCGSDKYYVRLVNRLIDRICTLNINNPPKDVEQVIALSVAAYLEDLVNDFGVWNAFRNIYRRTYGSWLPFYDCEHDEYMLDNVNIEDLRFIVWQAFVRCGQPDERIFSPYSDGFMRLADLMYDEIVDEFENAPESGRIANAITHCLSSNNYIKIRSLSFWLSASNPLIAPPFMHENMISQVRWMADNYDSLKINTISYTISASYSWSKATGPLGIQSTVYLAQMCRDRGMDKDADIISDTIVRSSEKYTIVSQNSKHVTLEDLAGQKYNVLKDSMSKDISTNSPAGCIAQLIRFNGEWNLNGIMFSIPMDDIRTDKETPRVTTEFTGPLKEMISELIEANNGQMVFLFNTLDEVRGFLKSPSSGTSISPVAETDNEESPKMQNIALLLSKESTPLLINGGAAYFKIKGNRRFSKRKSAESGLELIADGLPDDVAKYIQDNHLAPELQVYATQGVETGRNVVQHNFRFLAGFYRTKVLTDEESDIE